MSANLAINIIGFQLLWWLCVLGGNALAPLAGLLLMLHLGWHPAPYRETRIVLSCGLTGFVIDTLLMHGGLLHFTGATGVLAPLWLLLLWFGFAATLSTTFACLYQRLHWAAALGAVAAPLTYVGAAHLGAASLPRGELLTLWVLATVWVLLFPSLLLMARYVSGWGRHAS